MNHINGALSGMVCTCMLLAQPSRSQPFVIESIDSTGQLTFQAISNATNYRVECASSLTGSWSRVASIIHPPPAGMVTSSVAIPATGSSFYQVVATVTNAPPSIPEDMVLIPGGTNSGTDPDFGAYSLTVDSFYMDKYEVSKARWDDVHAWAVANGYSFDHTGRGKAVNHPVHGVSWYDMVKWCNARSEKEGRPAVYTVGGAVYRAGRESDVVQTPTAGYRLPTDVEWRYAARGGVSGLRFPWGANINHDHANYRANGKAYTYDTSPYTSFTYHPDYDDGGAPYTSPVGAFAANGYGLYDMAGNVRESCYDWAPGYEGSYRVLRGGSWNDYSYVCRVIFDLTLSPGPAYDTVGFRSVLSPGQP